MVCLTTSPLYRYTPLYILGITIIEREISGTLRNFFNMFQHVTTATSEGLNIRHESAVIILCIGKNIYSCRLSIKETWNRYTRQKAVELEMDQMVIMLILII